MNRTDGEARNNRWVQAQNSRLETIRGLRRHHVTLVRPSLRRRRGRVAVVTDAACGLPVDPTTGRPVLGALGEHLEIVPIPVMIDRGHRDQRPEMYPEYSPELSRDLPLALAQGLPVRTSRPAVGRIGQVYQRLHQQGFSAVVSIHLSAHLSGTYDAAVLAAESAPLPVNVVDSHQAGLGLGQAALWAAMQARTGADLEWVTANVNGMVAGSRSVFAVPSLEQLRRGGRINRIASVFGSMMRIKPVLELRQGEIAPLELTHSMNRAVSRMQEAAISHVQQIDAADTPRLGVQYCGNLQQAQELADKLQPHSSEPVPVLELPPALAAHLGLGALGITITKDGRPLLRTPPGYLS